MTEEQIRRYARHIVLESIGIHGQRRLLTASLSVEAAIGDWSGHCALAFLAAAGLGQLAVWAPPDRGLNAEDVRQSLIFESSDVGDCHFDALSRRLCALNPTLRVVRSSAKVDAINVDESMGWDLPAVGGGLALGLLRGAAFATGAICQIAASA